MPLNDNQEIGDTAEPAHQANDAARTEPNISYILHENVIERRGRGTSYVTFKKPVKPSDVTRTETMAVTIRNSNTPAYWDWLVKKYPPPVYVVLKVAYYRKPVLKYLEKRVEDKKDREPATIEERSHYKKPHACAMSYVFESECFISFVVQVFFYFLFSTVNSTEKQHKLNNNRQTKSKSPRKPAGLISMLAF